MKLALSDFFFTRSMTPLKLGEGYIIAATSLYIGLKHVTRAFYYIDSDIQIMNIFILDD